MVGIEGKRGCVHEIVTTAPLMWWRGSDRNPRTLTASEANARFGLALPVDRGKTVTKPFAVSGLGLLLSEKQIPQVVENLESGYESREALDPITLRVKQAL